MTSYGQRSFTYLSIPPLGFFSACICIDWSRFRIYPETYLQNFTLTNRINPSPGKFIIWHFVRYGRGYLDRLWIISGKARFRFSLPSVRGIWSNENPNPPLLSAGCSFCSSPSFLFPLSPRSRTYFALTCSRNLFFVNKVTTYLCYCSTNGQFGTNTSNLSCSKT